MWHIDSYNVNVVSSVVFSASIVSSVFFYLLVFSIKLHPCTLECIIHLLWN